MAVAFVAGTTGTISGAASLTISHTVSAGADRALVVMAVALNSADYLAAATVTYGGVSMGSPIVTEYPGSSNVHVYVWVLVAPAVGTANVVITPSAAAYIDALVSSYTGVHQTTPVLNSNKIVSAFGSSPFTRTITTASGGMAVDLFINRNTGQTIAPDATQTRIGSTIAGGVSTTSGSYKANAADMTWTTTGTSGSIPLGHTVIALEPAAAGDTTAPTLSSPTANATGQTTATVGATTDESNGTLYTVVTTSATQPSVAQIIAGQDHTGAAAAYNSSQAISSTGAKTFNATGLTLGTSYYAHFVHRDAAANDSARLSTAQFTTYPAAPAAPTIGATSSITATGATVSWTDNSTNETSFTVQLETPSGAGNWSTVATASANASSTTVGGLSSATEYRPRVRASNLGGDSAWSTGAAFTTLAGGGASQLPKLLQLLSS